MTGPKLALWVLLMGVVARGDSGPVLKSVLPILKGDPAIAKGGPATFHVRLESALTSYASPLGTRFSAVVISPLQIDGREMIPAGSKILGRVRRAKAVGIGLVHERAMLDLAFEEYELADGTRYPLGARLESVDNAREQVDSKGRIQGVLAASSPQGLVRGIWFRPDVGFIQRSVIGLTGIGGTLWSRFELGPAGAAGMLAARYIAFRLPDPEIQFPRGTEMRLRATSLPHDAPGAPVMVDEDVDESLAAWLRNRPGNITQPDGTPASDVINLAFIGSAKDVQNAFAAAGWLPTEPRTAHSLSTVYRAYSNMRGYATAPVSRMLYQETDPDVVFQKSFNTITKRHHIRIWQAGEFEGNEIWLAAASHDFGVGFRAASMTITHKIDLRTDFERRKVINDVRFAGCAERVSFVDRPPGPRTAGSQEAVTDGRMAVIWLQPCTADAAVDEPPFQVYASRKKRIVRRFVLETRQYFFRDNMYYWTYRATVGKFRSSPKPSTIEE